MNKDLQLKLLNLDTDHYVVKVCGPYVDGFADILEHEDGTIVFNSEVYCDTELSAIRADDVSVYGVVDDWQNEDLRSDPRNIIAAQAAEIERLTTESRQQREALVTRLLAETWQPIDTETKFDSAWAGPCLIVEEGGDILTMEAKNRGPSVKLEDGVRLCRLVTK